MTASLPRFMASLRAALMLAKKELAREVSSALRWKPVKLGAARLIKMVINVRVTSSSMSVKPLQLCEEVVISSKR